MDAAIDAVVEIFTWVGFGAGALLAGIALVAYLLDGTWVPARAVVEDHRARHGRALVRRGRRRERGAALARAAARRRRRRGWPTSSTGAAGTTACGSRSTRPFVRAVALLAAGLDRPRRRRARRLVGAAVRARLNPAGARRGVTPARACRRRRARARARPTARPRRARAARSPRAGSCPPGRARSAPTRSTGRRCAARAA